ncbi:MAG TPA: nuclear transport factor 2 family protein [Acidobacteriaceae bacterium]
MTETNLDKVMALLAAIRAQDADKVLQLVAPRFVQHTPYIADGVEGLRQFILDATSDQVKLSLVRAIADGQLVVAQLRLESSGENRFAVFRFQNGLIAEQWAFSSPDAPPNESGHTQLDSPTEPTDLADTDRNKAVVHKYYETFHLAGNHDQNGEFFAGNLMIRHEPGVRDGLDEFLRDVKILMQHRTIDELRLLAGQGDLVFIAAKGAHENDACAYIDLYRVEDEKIVEHWGFPQMFPPQSVRMNPNSML